MIFLPAPWLYGRDFSRCPSQVGAGVLPDLLLVGGEFFPVPVQDRGRGFLSLPV